MVKKIIFLLTLTRPTKSIAITLSILLLLVLFSSLVACSPPASKPVSAQKPEQATISIPAPTPVPNPVTTPPSTPKPSGLIKAKWIEPQVNSSIVSIPINEVKNNWNTHFKLTKQGSNLTFMAYILDGEIYVRASICPPCKGISYSLDSDILVCDICATTFKAKTGAGIKGPCVNYPKAVVQYKIVDGNIVMNEAELVNSYQATLKPG